MNLDRFPQGLADTQEATVVDHCEECGGEIYSGQQVWKVGSDMFCKTECLLDNLGVETLTVGDE